MADIKKILENMTIREKIGQLSQYDANLFIDTDAAVTGHIEWLGLSDGDLSCVGHVLNFKSPAEMRQIQREHLEKDRNKIPMLFMMDVIHGFRTIYPIPLAMGCSFDPDMVKECSRMTAKEAVRGGVQVTFTPMVDYVRDARWGRVMESTGEDAYLNSVMGAAQVRAFQGDDLSDKENIASCVKHFAAYGGAEAGRDYNTVELSEHTLREHYLPAYKACLDAGAEMIMPSFNTLNGIPSTANSWLMKTILKDEWGFNGIVISDYSAVKELMDHGVAEDGKAAARLAFDNNCDIEMCSAMYFNHLEGLIEEGVFTLEQLDKAVLKVLDLKNRLGMFDDPYRGADKTDIELTPENRDIARRAAENCAVLLKNDGVLPFKKSVTKIAVIGPFADNHNIIGFWSCNGKNEESVTVAEGIKRLLPGAEVTVVRGCGDEWDDTDTSGFDKAVNAAKAADAVVLCLGEPQDYSGEGNSRLELELHKIQLELARAVIDANTNTAVVTFSGRPIVLTELEKAAPAILNMWFPGTEGGTAAANLLFGVANPSGKLSMTFPRATGQCPIYYNHTNIIKYGKSGAHKPYCASYIEHDNLPLYSFGHGLSYSEFVYEGLELSKDSMKADESIEISITVRNASDIAGKETVMLYMCDPVASNARPVQQLIGFKKIYFEPNERKTIKFTVTEPMLRFWNNNNEFVSEPGEFRLSTGYADHLILTKEFVLK
ncbi:MAG: glycoside hydrolase family 3 C-terminal domain-containing protein [Clostridia bacterium]|nr:glycoside hydrolase family 3 C-terminal domain-containing protein [Clostridia bacterium]